MSFANVRSGKMGKKTGNASSKGQGRALTSLLILISLVAILTTYMTQGPSWDLISQYLNARSFSTSQFLLGNFHIFNPFVIQHGIFYIEIFRPPIESFALALISLVSQNSILVYLIVLFAIFLLSIRFLARSLEVDMLLIYGLMLNPYFIYLSFTIDSTDILSVSMIMVAIALLYKKDPLCGLFFGIAGLSKYPALIFLPLILLLENRDKVLRSFSLFLLITLPWLIFNYVYFANPLASYLSSIDLTLANSNIPTSISAFPAIASLIMPAVFLVVGMLHFRPAQIKKLLSSSFRSSFYAKILLLFIPLSVLCYLVLSLHSTGFDQTRFADFISLSGILIIIPILQKGSENAVHLTRDVAIASASIMIIAMALNLSAYYNAGTLSAGPYNVISQRSTILAGLETMDSIGYGNCSMVSNSWVYLLYLNASAYSPFSLNATNSLQYPLLIFNQVGVARSLISNIGSYSTAYNGSYYSILLPRNASCAK